MPPRTGPMHGPRWARADPRQERATLRVQRRNADSDCLEQHERPDRDDDPACHTLAGGGEERRDQELGESPGGREHHGEAQDEEQDGQQGAA
jgi:hypothetical protein